MNESPEDIQNRKEANDHLSLIGRKFFKFIEFDSNEKLVTEIRKHPFGLFLIFASGAFVILSITIMSAVVSAVNLNDTLGISGINSYKTIIILISFFVVVGAIIMTLIAAFLYRSNVIYVTNEKIAQVVYVSLFNRKISQLSIGDVQDVTVSQKGIFAHVLNYGTLVIETAGEQQNYTFSFVPDPYTMSKLIVGSHERNLVLHGN